MKKPLPTTKTERDFWNLTHYEQAISEARRESDKHAALAARLSSYAAEMSKETVKFDVKDFPLLKDT